MRFSTTFFIALSVAVLMMLGSVSCRKQQRFLNTGGVVTFSDDTLTFDTVFTAAGSFTTGLLIYNTQNESINLSSVRLKGGSTSYFHINVDGFTGNAVTNIKIAAHDSVYVFATVNINPTDTNTPFIVTDELIATLNGREFSVPFTAYGQNAHYVIGDSIGVNTTWLTDKPYVVMHSCVVGPLATLTIPNKCKVYMHQDARFFVFGNLQVNPFASSVNDSVIFQGDRLDRDYFGYRGYPGEWGGFYFVQGSTGNIKNAIIKNCGGATSYRGFYTRSAAIQVDTAAQLTITNSTVKNSIGFGILNFQGNVTAANCLIATTGGEAFVNLQGGIDSLTNCTFANYGDAKVQLDHVSSHTVVLLNYYQVSQTEIYYGALDAVLRNCIVYGSLDSEIICDKVAGIPARITLDHSLIKIGDFTDPFVSMLSCIRNQDPMFKSTTDLDFQLQATSPAISAGTTSHAPALDLLYKPRSGHNDIGCYQYIP